MPRVTLTFDLPEEQNELWAALRAGVYANALWEIDQRCRSVLKYGSGTLTGDELEAIRSAIADTGVHEEL